LDGAFRLVLVLLIATVALPVRCFAQAAANSLPPSLATFEVQPGSLAASSSDGQIVTLDVQQRRIAVWDDDGSRRADFALPAALANVRPSLLVARPGQALVGVADSAGGLKYALVDLRSHEVTAEFGAGLPPAKVFAGVEGWVVEPVSPGEAPRLLEYNQHGKLVRESGAPQGVVERAAQELGRPEAASLRIAAPGGRLWAVPAGMYELWLLHGTPTRFQVPECLRVKGNEVTGDAGRRKFLQMIERGDKAARRQIESTVADALGTSRPFHGFFAAVVTVVSRGEALGVLLDAHPEELSGGCRLDVWQVSDQSLSAVVPIPGVCPSVVALGTGGAWVLQAGHFTWLSFSGHESAAALGCPASQVPTLKPADASPHIPDSHASRP